MEWLKNGDKNKKFFHAVDSQRRRKKNIEGLMDSMGLWHEEDGRKQKQ